MGIPKGPAEGGSGGKRGHTNMEHWGYTNEVKDAARRRRRLDTRKLIAEEVEQTKQQCKCVEHLA